MEYIYLTIHVLTMVNKLYKYLERIYYDPAEAGSFGGVLSLYRQAKRSFPNLKISQIKKWLMMQDVYTLHKPARRKFKRNRVYVDRKDELWQLDLADLSSLKKYNQKFKYILTCIDVLSKYAWVVPLKDKTGKTLVKALMVILSSERIPELIQTDKGSEFTNKLFQNKLKELNINFYTTGNETKASVVERFNRTLKTRMYKYFTHKNTLKYIDILPKLVQAYNSSYHRSIKMAPKNVTNANQHVAWENLYKNDVRHSRNFQFKVGDQVRISKSKLKFEKGYLPNYTGEIFTIAKRYPRNPVVYALNDYSGEQITGTFYEHELVKVVKNKDSSYEVEKVLRKRKRNGKTQYFVKWKSYPPKFNSWVDTLYDPNKRR